jgi:hypothetical protein
VRFKSSIALHAAGETIRREPGLWDKFRTVFGGSPDLDTGRVRTQVTTAHLVQGVKRSLERLGVDNAIALVIDGQVLFEDRAGREEDFGDLFLAFYENEAVYGQDFEELRLTVEHRQAGVHYVIEIVGRGEHVKDEATAKAIIAGRITEFEPRPDEDAETFRLRVTPHLETPAFTETHRLQFESFVERVRDGLRDAMPDVRVSGAEAKSLVERPARREGPAARPAKAPQNPYDARYDPYDRHYPSPMHDVATLLFWHSMMSWTWHPHYVVVDPSGSELGAFDDLAHTHDPGGDFDPNVGEAPDIDVADAPDMDLDVGDGLDVDIFDW